VSPRVIALVADGEESAEALPLALATLAAVLEHGGRLLLAADASLRLPLLYAAAEYAVALEAGAPPPPAPVLLAPFPNGDSFEEQLLANVAELTGGGVAETPEGSFAALLAETKPAAVLMLGHSSRVRELVRAADGTESRVLDIEIEAGSAAEPFRRVAPRLDGRPVGEYGGDLVPRIAFDAAELAALTLGIEQVVAELLGDAQSIAPGEHGLAI
jgi:hypothetical protein